MNLIEESVRKQKVLVLADISNLFYCVKRNFNGRRLDYSRFLEAAVNGRTLYRAIAYGAELDGEADEFKKALKAFGFDLKYKQTQVYTGIHPVTNNAVTTRKADWDVGMAMDAVEILPAVDVVVFGTADGDMVPCLSHIKSRGKVAEVLASGISRQLKEVANGYEEIGLNLLEVSPRLKEVS